MGDVFENMSKDDLGKYLTQASAALLAIYQLDGLNSDSVAELSKIYESYGIKITKKGITADGIPHYNVNFALMGEKRSHKKQSGMVQNIHLDKNEAFLAHRNCFVQKGGNE